MRLTLVVFLLVPFAALAQRHDLVLKGGRIIDGTGNPWFYGDVAIDSGRIVAVGNLDDVVADSILDVHGLIIAPGFIDVHTHIERNSLLVPTADNFIFDGVTTVVTGNCGSSNVDISDFFRKLDSVRTSINVATLIGHNSVRAAVMGESMRDPSTDEQKKMEALVAQGMRDGAVGFSTGLIYVPGTYSKTAEVLGLAMAAAKFHGVYSSHIRDESDGVKEAIAEALNVGYATGMAVEISHFKVASKENWGRSVETLAMVENARMQGVDVTIDQYPYVASSTTLNTALPTWVFSGGADSVEYRLTDPSTRRKVKEQMLRGLKRRGLKNYGYAVVAGYPADPSYDGKSIPEVNRLMGRKPRAANEAETIMDLVANGGAQMVFFTMSEEDVQRIMRYPFNMFASDAGIIRFGVGAPHPRAYATNARVIAHYVRKLNLLSLEEAVRRMTSLPAQKFHLHDRGLVRQGMAADLVIFDEKAVSDVSTFSHPHAYSTGFEYVIVNGAITVARGKHTGARNGQPLKGPGIAVPY
jgi:N-acyl-D-amino-acid deacylase